MLFKQHIYSTIISTKKNTKFVKKTNKNSVVTFGHLKIIKIPAFVVHLRHEASQIFFNGNTLKTQHFVKTINFNKEKLDCF